MLEWKKDFTDHGIDCSIHYILERKPEEFVVKCVDGCQGIGQCGNPTLPQIKVRKAMIDFWVAKRDLMTFCGPQYGV